MQRFRLLIKKVSRDHHGKYKCTVKNGSETVSAETQLKVFHEPEIFDALFEGKNSIRNKSILTEIFSIQRGTCHLIQRRTSRAMPPANHQ